MDRQESISKSKNIQNIEMDEGLMKTEINLNSS
jgi:hypothetical protein